MKTNCVMPSAEKKYFFGTRILLALLFGVPVCGGSVLQAQAFNTHINSDRGEIFIADNDNSSVDEDFVWMLDHNSWTNGSKLENMRLSKNSLFLYSRDTWQTSLQIGNSTGGVFHFNVAGSGQSGAKVLPQGGFGIYDNTKNTYRFVINGDGNVGVGTAFPDGRLDIRGAGNGAAKVQLVGSDNVNATWRIATPSIRVVAFGGNSNHNVDIGYFANDQSSFTSRMRVNTNGNVGIGTTSPEVRLQIKTPTAMTAVTTGTEPAIRLIRDGTTNDKWSSSADIELGTSSANINANSMMKFRLGRGSTATPNTDVMTLLSNGNVGIGTTSPTAKMHLVTNATRASAGNTITSNESEPRLKTSLRVLTNSSNTMDVYEGAFGMNLWGESDHENSQYPFLNIETLQPNVPIVMEVGDKPVMQIFQKQILIGANLPYPENSAIIPYSGLNYTLGVRGRIVSSSLTCKDLSQWADYVFGDEYRLRPLSEVADYVNRNRHLPDVPSEAELKKTGVDVTDMLKIHMQKIEELTLYLIEQEKQLKAQQIQINELKQQLNNAR